MATGQLFITAEQEVQSAAQSLPLQGMQGMRLPGINPVGGPPVLGQILDPGAPISAPTVTPLIQPAVIGHAAVFYERQQHAGRIIQNRWPGYQWAGLPPVTPTPQQIVVGQARATAAAQQNRARSSNIYQLRSAALETFATPPRGIVVGQAEQTAIRRAHHGSIVQSRWPGYQWVGLPPVTPTPRQIVQDQSAVWQARQDHRRGAVIAPPVQQLASAGTGPPPFSGPLPRQTVILARATPRQARSGHVIQARNIQAPVTPPRPITIDSCSVARRRARGGHVIIGRPNTQPVTPPRQKPIQPLVSRRRRRGGVVRQGPQLAVFGSVGPPPSTLITTPLTGIVSVGDHGYISSGDTGQPSAGDTGPVKTGSTGYPHI